LLSIGCDDKGLFCELLNISFLEIMLISVSVPLA